MCQFEIWSLPDVYRIKLNSIFAYISTNFIWITKQTNNNCPFVKLICLQFAIITNAVFFKNISNLEMNYKIGKSGTLIGIYLYVIIKLFYKEVKILSTYSN